MLYLYIHHRGLSFTDTAGKLVCKQNTQALSSHLPPKDMALVMVAVSSPMAPPSG